MWKIRFFSSLIFLVLLSSSSQAYFDELISQELQERWIPQLNHPKLEQRFLATQAIFQFPQWALPILREALLDPQFHAFHWRFAHLLGVLGESQDIPLLLKTSPHAQNAFESQVWKDAAQRLFWRHRFEPEPQVLIEQLEFTPTTMLLRSDSSMLSGDFHYNLVNHSKEGQLIQVEMRHWYAKPTSPSRTSTYYWLEPQEQLEKNIPLVYQFFPETPKIRIEFKVKVVGHPKVIAAGRVIHPLIEEEDPNASDDFIEDDPTLGPPVILRP